jgi:very-short-patch-repair endonuclease
LTIDISHLVNLCRSPVERMFMQAMVSDWARDASISTYGECEYVLNPRHLVILRGGDDLIVVPQHRVGRYTLDFCLQFVGARGQRVAVEVDGHHWHERTKEQARADRQRDRSLLAADIITVRFTGSEVWECADRCAAEAIDLADALRSFGENLRQDGFALAHRVPQLEELNS